MNFEKPQHNVEEREVSEHEKHIVEAVESLPEDLYWENEKAELILVAQGLKPATDPAPTVTWLPGEEPKKVDQEKVESTIQLLKRLGFYVTKPELDHEDAVIYEDGTRSAGAENLRLYVAREAETAENLKRAYAEKDDITFGRLSGFPETAVQEFVKTREMLWEERSQYLVDVNFNDIPKEVRELPYMAFAQFRLSKNNWKEKIKTAERWAKEIERLSPALYNKITSDYLEKVYRQNKWDEMELGVSGITDGLGKEIDAGIKDAVIALKLLELNTTQSCEGHEDRGTGGPYVDVESSKAKSFEEKYDKLTDYESEEADALRKEITRHNLEERKKLFPLLQEFYSTRTTPEDIRLSIKSYGLGISRIENQGVSLQEIAQTGEYKENLEKYQKEMKAFTFFLKNKFFYS